MATSSSTFLPSPDFMAPTPDQIEERRRLQITINRLMSQTYRPYSAIISAVSIPTVISLLFLYRYSPGKQVYDKLHAMLYDYFFKISKEVTDLFINACQDGQIFLSRFLNNIFETMDPAYIEKSIWENFDCSGKTVDECVRKIVGMKELFAEFDCTLVDNEKCKLLFIENVESYSNILIPEEQLQELKLSVINIINQLYTLLFYEKSNLLEENINKYLFKDLVAKLQSFSAPLKRCSDPLSSDVINNFLISYARQESQFGLNAGIIFSKIGFGMVAQYTLTDFLMKRWYHPQLNFDTFYTYEAIQADIESKKILINLLKPKAERNIRYARYISLASLPMLFLWYLSVIFKNVKKDELSPELLMLGISMLILALNNLWKDYQEYQQRKNYKSNLMLGKKIIEKFIPIPNIKECIQIHESNDSNNLMSSEFSIHFKSQNDISAKMITELVMNCLLFKGVSVMQIDEHTLRLPANFYLQAPFYLNKFKKIKNGLMRSETKEHEIRTLIGASLVRGKQVSLLKEQLMKLMRALLIPHTHWEFAILLNEKTALIDARMEFSLPSYLTFCLNTIKEIFAKNTITITNNQDDSMMIVLLGHEYSIESSLNKLCNDITKFLDKRRSPTPSIPETETLKKGSSTSNLHFFKSISSDIETDTSARAETKAVKTNWNHIHYNSKDPSCKIYPIHRPGQVYDQKSLASTNHFIRSTLKMDGMPKALKDVIQSRLETARFLRGGNKGEKHEQGWKRWETLHKDNHGHFFKTSLRLTLLGDDYGDWRGYTRATGPNKEGKTLHSLIEIRYEAHKKEEREQRHKLLTVKR